MPAGGLIDRERSVSPAIAVILMATVAIILSATIGALVLSSGDDGATQEPAPQISAEIERGPGQLSPDNEKITISHKGGDTVDVSELKIITETYCFDSSSYSVTETNSELVDLPVDSGSGIQDKNVAGKNIFQGSFGATEAPLLESSDNGWRAGRNLVFTIDDNECDVREDMPVSVFVVHEPSNTVISEEVYGTENFQTASPADASYDYSFPNPRPGSAGFPDQKDILTVGITDGGQFPPEDVYLDVTVDDGTTTASANGSLDEWTGVDAGYGADYNEVPENPGVGLVGAGDRVGSDLTSGNSGPGGFGPLDEDASSTTDIDVKVKFKGNIVSQKTLTGNGFEVDP